VRIFGSFFSPVIIFLYYERRAKIGTPHVKGYAITPSQASAYSSLGWRPVTGSLTYCMYYTILFILFQQKLCLRNGNLHVLQESEMEGCEIVAHFCIFIV